MLSDRCPCGRIYFPTIRIEIANADLYGTQVIHNASGSTAFIDLVLTNPNRLTHFLVFLCFYNTIFSEILQIRSSSEWAFYPIEMYS